MEAECGTQLPVPTTQQLLQFVVPQLGSGALHLSTQTTSELLYLMHPAGAPW